jgi:hypothetical protein
MLLMELEGLQAKRRDALATYNRTGDRAWMREAQEASQAINNMLREMEEIDDPTIAVDGLMAKD